MSDYLDDRAYIKNWGSKKYEERLGALIKEADRQAQREPPPMIDATKIYPYPEVLRRSKTFRIEDTKDEAIGMTQLKTHHMIVPLADTEQASATRSHEGDHLLFSENMTAEQKSMGMVAMAVEDGRIGLMHEAAGWEFEPDPICDHFPQFLKSLEKEVVRFAMYTGAEYVRQTEADVKGVGLRIALSRIAVAGDKKISDQFNRQLRESVPKPKGSKINPWTKAVELSDKLTGKTLSILGKPGKKTKKNKHLSCRTCKRRKVRGQANIPCVHTNRALAASRWLYKWMVKNNVTPPSEGSGASSNCEGHAGKKPGRSKELSPYMVRAQDGQNIPHGRKLQAAIIADRWGQMSIESPPRTHRAIPRARKAPLSYSRKMGVVPDRIHNWCSGRRVFSWVQPEGQKGGSIVIDCSGSMRFSKEALISFVKAAPGLTIAGYSGNGYTGTLRIYVKKGMIVADEYLERPDRGDNTVDGPAIAWLATQKGPRFWISDLGVTGLRSDLSDLTLQEECIRFCRKHSIIIIPELHMAERVLLKHYGAPEGG